MSRSEADEVVEARGNNMDRIHAAIRMVEALQRDALYGDIPRFSLRLREVLGLLTRFRDEGGCNGFLDLVSNSVLLGELERRLGLAAHPEEGG